MFKETITEFSATYKLLEKIIQENKVPNQFEMCDKKFNFSARLEVSFIPRNKERGHFLVSLKFPWGSFLGFLGFPGIP